MRPVVIQGVDTRWRVTSEGELFKTNGERAKDTQNEYGYIINNVFGAIRKRHRLVAAAFVVNPRPDIFDFVDHIDGNRANNRAENLRWVNQQINSLNRVDALGFQKIGDKFHSKIRFCDMQHYLGSYTTAEEAHKIAKYTRISLLEALYHYHTRPNTFKSPSLWRMEPCRVYVC